MTKALNIILGVSTGCFVVFMINYCTPKVPYHAPKQSCNLKKIISIGACNNSGTCGVQYESGEYDKINYPLLNQFVNICRGE